MPELPPETNEATRAGNCVMRILVFPEHIPDIVWPPASPMGAGQAWQGRADTWRRQSRHQGRSPLRVKGAERSGASHRAHARHRGCHALSPHPTLRHEASSHVMTCPMLPLITQDLVTTDAVCYRLRLLDLSVKCEAVLVPVRVLIHMTLLKKVFISKLGSREIPHLFPNTYDSVTSLACLREQLLEAGGAVTKFILDHIPCVRNTL